MTRTRLILIRHGQTDWNAGGRFQGQADIPLNQHGVEQAESLAAHADRLGFDRVVASDLVRAVETGRLLAEARGVPLTQDARLREIHVGTWEGMTPDEAWADDPAAKEALLSGVDFRRSATGETATEAGQRVRDALADLGGRFEGETTAIVGHGLALRVGMALLVGLDHSASLAFNGLWNCSWTTLERRAGAWKILHYNSVVPGHSGGLKSVNAP